MQLSSQKRWTTIYLYKTNDWDFV